MNPIVSVIIPTAGLRPCLLARSVKSALAEFALGEAEVVIVPNGPELQWRDSLVWIKGQPNVRICPIQKSSASAARNHGLANAKGKLVRFLDDDDYLIPNIAVRQCRQLLDAFADVSSYAIRIEDEFGNQYLTKSQPVSDDFVAAHLGPDCLPLPFAHVYRRELISSIQWNESYTVGEDIAWLITVCCERNIKWIKSDDVVGIWYQHTGTRLSLPHPAHEPNRVTAEAIFHTVEVLDRKGQMYEERKCAAAFGLWLCVHRGFYLHPLYWHRVAKRIYSLTHNKTYPPTFFFTLPFTTYLDPLIMQWLLLPLRSIIYGFLCTKSFFFGGWKYVRKL